MNTLTEEYSLVIGQDVIWGDMDAFGHVNNTVYFRYFEDARIAYLDKIGMREEKAASNFGPILATAQCNFRRPLEYPDRVHIGIRATILSPKKFNMEFAIYSEQHQAIVADGDGLAVYFDYSKGKSCEIPEGIVAAMTSLEG
jgi:acyl-CoA thioester hydrolase